MSGRRLSISGALAVILSFALILGVTAASLSTIGLQFRVQSVALAR
jgi:purine-cytosine permease-like protein